jgi:ABC-type Zn uptake system ZnuABC Zn-binding protein ZnuA
MSEISEFLNKFRINPNISQTFHNNQLSSVLTKMYNSAEINVQSSSLNSGSILLKRLRKPNILIENKDISENVSIDDINNFIQLIEEHNCNGIFISQNSGISTKKNYQIDIVNKNIVVFLHNVEYCSLKISNAVDIIDNLSMKFRLFKEEYKTDDISIPKELLDTINKEYQLFISQKNAVVDILKENQKKVISQLDEIRFPCLDKFLSTKYSLQIQKPGLKCDVCKAYNANNLKALAAHKRGCNRKHINKISLTSSSSSSSSSVSSSNTPLLQMR